MKPITKFAIFLVATLILQSGTYLYMNFSLFAPTTSFEVKSATGTTNMVVDGDTHFSTDKRYMAVVKTDKVEIYETPKKLLRTIELKDDKLTYFHWLNDRNLALMAVQNNNNQRKETKIVLSQINPLMPDHNLSTVVDKLPLDSKVTDVAFSTATNVIYMQILTDAKQDLYRVYRTDANQDLTRVHLQTNKLGRIGVLYDHDALIYDNVDNGIVYVRDGDGSWRVISPAGAKYRLVGVDGKNNIYIAKVNKQGLAEAVYKGRLKQGFELDRTLNTPTEIKNLTMEETTAPAKPQGKR